MTKQYSLSPSIGAQIAQIVGAPHTINAVPKARRVTTLPVWIARPNSAAEISELVKLACKTNIVIIPLGRELRDVTCEPDPGRRRIFVDLTRMRHVLSLDEKSLLVHAQAGTTAHALEKILGHRNLSLGDYPPASLSSSLGALLAVRTPGKISDRHGFIEDAVLSISAVLPNGRTIHTRVAPRRATGPDIARALCGSEGTLGIITSAVLRIHRQPESRYLAAYALSSFSNALAAAHLALREEAAPSVMHVYNASESQAYFGNLGVKDGALLLVATAGLTDLAACDRDLVSSAVEALEGQPMASEVAENWWQCRAGENNHLPPSPHLQFSATPSRQRVVCSNTVAAAESAGFLIRAHASRFAIDDGVMFFTFTDTSGQLLTQHRLAEARKTIEEVAVNAGAYLLGDLHQQLHRSFQQLKQVLDPQTIMNPGVLRARDHERPTSRGRITLAPAQILHPPQ